MSTPTPPTGEPSVLDYLKSRLSLRRGERVEIPAMEGGPQPRPDLQPLSPLPWRSLLALVAALFAQLTFEPIAGGTRSAWSGSVLYLFAFGLLVFAYRRGELTLPSLAAEEAGVARLAFRWLPFVLSMGLGAVAFFAMSGNLFTFWNLILWLGAVALYLGALWFPQTGRASFVERIREFLARPEWVIRVTRWTLLMLAVMAVVLFFRLYQLGQVPPEMTSDHAEKLLDVNDILNGQYSIFFPRNTGREPLYIYLCALLAAWFTGLSYLTLKIGAVIGGLLMLPYLYLLGREMGSRRIGLLAVLFAGIAYWPNVIERFSLRISFYPLFVAPTLYYLVRGLRRKTWNDFIFAGLALGLGLNGYTPFRIMPLVVVAVFLVYVLHVRTKEALSHSLVWLGVVALTALMIFIPLGRYATERPDLFSYRAFTRLESIEQPLPGPAGQIFLSNLWNALKMFNWNNGNIWVHSIPGRPALDVVSGALFLLGVLLLLMRYLQKRQWLDLMLLLSVPLLLMPSILSLAFPTENPSLNRTGGAIVPVFLIVGIASDGLLSVLERRPGKRFILIGSVMAMLLFVSMYQNYDLVFHQYYQEYRGSAWNTSEMGEVIREFARAQGSSENAWIIPFPYWADTRLSGFLVGVPGRDFAIQRQDLPNTLDVPGAKLFLFKVEDQDTLTSLRQLYPQGFLSRFKSAVQGEDFYIFLVPPPAALQGVRLPRPAPLASRFSISV
jgi:4-amino-4-deoxy-L-arabinose transferase-like glycosyltransferase